MKQYKTPWQGWNFADGYLVDPDGNKYSPDMIRSSIWTIQLKHELTGSELKIKSLKQELEKRLALPAPEIVIRWNGQETVIKPPIPKQKG
jgi:hypothetical protein